MSPSSSTGTGDEKVVYTFPKNAHEEVRAYFATFNGHRIAHIRVYRANENDGDYPTRKGLAVRLTDVPELHKAVTALVDALPEEEQ